MNHSVEVLAQKLNRFIDTGTLEPRPSKLKEPNCLLDLEQQESEYHPSKDKLYREGRLKPLLRGVLHEIQFFCWPFYAYFLLKDLHHPRAIVAACIFLLCYLVCFGASSQYHRRKWWSNEAELFMQKLDHCGIFLIITGSYTVPALLVLSWYSGIIVLGIIWVGCLHGCWAVFFQKNTSNTLSYVLLGSSLFPWMNELFHSLTSNEAQFAMVSWLLLSVAVGVFVTGKGDFFPNVFGFHEVFHVFISLASVFTYLAVLSIVKRYETL